MQEWVTAGAATVSAAPPQAIGGRNRRDRKKSAAAARPRRGVSRRRAKAASIVNPVGGPKPAQTAPQQLCGIPWPAPEEARRPQGGVIPTTPAPASAPWSTMAASGQPRAGCASEQVGRVTPIQARARSTTIRAALPKRVGRPSRIPDVSVAAMVVRGWSINSQLPRRHRGRHDLDQVMLDPFAGRGRRRREPRGSCLHREHLAGAAADVPGRDHRAVLRHREGRGVVR